MIPYKLKDLVEEAKAKSPFYKKLYKHVDHSFFVNELPIVDQTLFWEANQYKNNALLTSDYRDGIVFRSGGTTGNPKFSYFTKHEWEMFCQEFGTGMDYFALEDGDRIANLFYAGDMYASFLFINKSIELSKKSVLQFPISGQVDLEEMVNLFAEYEIDTLACVPTTFFNLIPYLKKSSHRIKKVLYGGESFYPDQLMAVRKSLPEVDIRSIGYASVDGGHLGLTTSDCSLGEQRVFNRTSIIEILDEETNEPIWEVGRPGKIIFTNLIRKSMPIIRYPVGDIAEWRDLDPIDSFCGPKFKILGRSSEGARIGPVTLNFDDIQTMIHDYKNHEDCLGTQLLLERRNSKDLLRIKVAVQDYDEWDQEDFRNHIYNERPMLVKAVNDNIINPIEVEIGDLTILEKNKRTGKSKQLIDLR